MAQTDLEFDWTGIPHPDFDGSVKWWNLEDFGPYRAPLTEAEYVNGGYGPFDTFEAAFEDWKEKVGWAEFFPLEPQTPEEFYEKFMRPVE